MASANPPSILTLFLFIINFFSLLFSTIAKLPVKFPAFLYWTCSTTRLVVEQVLQNAPHFAVFKRKLFRKQP
jgi:hypothetical protein